MTIVHLIPYPIEPAYHGGQIRSRKTNQALRDNFSSVTTICIFDMGGYAPNISSVDVSQEVASGRWTDDWKVRDFVVGDAVAETPERFREFAELFPVDTSLIVVEEPWLSRAAIKVKEQHFPNAKIIYNSHNVETIAKNNILSGADNEMRSEYIERIESVERRIVSLSDHVNTVTEQDADYYKLWRKGAISVAPNGSDVRSKASLRNVIHHGIEPSANYAIFVGSAHGPNIEGFKNLIPSCLDILGNEERIIVAGGVCDPLVEVALNGDRPYGFRDKVCLLGRVTNFGLECLISNASAILLPITYGGGSNLKTAEALLSGKPIAGTSKAFRGYEGFIKAPGVWVGDTPDEFARAIREALNNGDRTFTRAGTEALLWHNTLSPIIQSAKSLYQ